ncbi:MAG: phosphoglycerate dehydrogenase [Gammaproteobacteria bacterium]|nr:phosphoglycerate dehydrogenase [Gammaproteobacteria bacterium]NIR82478.1 phosphoglycerate dehydrogenase [Gammaproteobacteria bacterium]NIR88474.1 phosphoglycerate dehydrogenase [Gammaproteobacteria bacterium]NIU03614.1 phosphoglycerate dehydrogenase [Gammaproteobacteria bacterium]NIV50966.1 3-phosphoglycerate dehydrogenase [Gammaproteobacteria bacterium]
MFKIQTLNNISVAGLERFPRERYEIASEFVHPDAVLLRSFDMHRMELPPSLKAVGRAGAGVNNIPVDALSARGVPVFNTPGANAGAVAEMALAALFLAARNICRAWAFARALEGDDDEIERRVEAGKKQFRGFELPGRALGVVGLGAIGVRVANAALGLGMRVIGYDPDITVQRAWQLSAQVQQALSVDDLLAHADFVSIHVPLDDKTRHLLDAERLAIMREGACLLNFSRRAIVDEVAVSEALDAGRLHAYVCDFPSRSLSAHPRVVTLPHIGASTREAEDNCAIMVAEQVRGYLEDGIIQNSVNFPDVVMPRVKGYRLAVVNANVPNMLGQISTCLANAGLNIVDMLNNSRGELAYTLTDVEGPVPDACVEEISGIDGVMSVRAL